MPVVLRMKSLMSSFPGGGTTQCTVGVPLVAHGVISYGNGQQLGPWQPGSTVTLYCNAGYYPSGSVISTCMGNGLWLPESLGPCRFTGTSPFTCQAVPLVLGGTVTYNNPRLPPYPQGTIATLKCLPGYTLSGSATVVCVGGIWSPGMGVCKLDLLIQRPVSSIVGEDESEKYEDELFCPAPTASPFGEITFSNTSSPSGFSSGTTATLQCGHGRTVTGPSFSTCSQGMFRPILGKCTIDRQIVLPGVCLPLTAPINGRITYIHPERQDKFEVGTTALLYCLDSFAVTGHATVVCTDDGWRPASGLGQCDSTTTANASAFGDA